MTVKRKNETNSYNDVPNHQVIMTTIEASKDQASPAPPKVCTNLATILIVDDERLILKALEKTLTDDKYRVLTAQNGAEALKILDEEHLAVIICDQKMPDMTGVEVLKEAVGKQPQAVRILLTGFGDLETVMKAINIGQASQFILKPWDNESLKQTIAESVSKFLLQRENEELQELMQAKNAALSKANALLKREHVMGARVQNSMLMGSPPKDHPNLEIAAKTIPTKDIDGDFYDFFPVDDYTLDLVIGDVMGKGLPAALVGIAVKTQIMRYAKPVVSHHHFNKKHQWRKSLLTPAEIVSNIRKQVNSQLSDLEYFVTLLYARFNFQKQKLTFIDCGSPKTMHYSAKNQSVRELKGENFPLGVVDDEEYSEIVCGFEKEDCFIFYSDGVTEARSPQGELFGIKRLHRLIESAGNQPAEAILQTINQKVMSFTQKSALDDDITIIVVKVKNPLPIYTVNGKNMLFASTISQVKAVRKFVDRICSKAPGDHERLSNEMQLVMDEIFSNVVLHGHANNKEGEIEIYGSLTNDGVVFQVIDQGKRFDPTLIEEPELTGNKNCGFGWYLIKELTDRITYVPKDSDHGNNSLTIYKQFILNEDKMEISHNAQNNVLVVTLEGDHLDAKEAEQFKEQILKLCQNEDVFKVIFDLHRLKFIDSSGLGSFLTILKGLKSRQGDLKLSGMSGTIKMMFELVSMHKIFEIFNSTDEALQSFD